MRIPPIAVAVGWMVAAVAAAGPPIQDRSPVDLALTADGKWLVTANQTSGTATLIDVARQRVVAEIEVGEYPVSVVAGGEPDEIWMSCRDSGTVVRLAIDDGELDKIQTRTVGYHPWGLAWDPRRGSLWVAQRAAGRVVELDGAGGEVVRTVEVGNWPERLAISPQASHLVVTLAGEQGMAIVDLNRGSVRKRSFRALNQGQPIFSDDGTEVWLPWMMYRAFPINPTNIRRGWVWGSRLGRIPLDDSGTRRILTLDQRGRAVADPCDMSWVGDGSQLVMTAGGTHELLWFRRKRLPWRDYAGTDHMDPRLIPDQTRFRRIALGGRPQGIAAAPGSTTVYVANYLRNSVQVVDLREFRVVHEIDLGGPREPSPARLGAAIFYDAGRSLDQWYSCHTCHQDGGTNAVATDTLNDGSARTFKTILPLYDLPRTRPWTWHGWQTDLRAAMTKSLTSTMLGTPPSEKEIDALLSFFDQLKRPVNPFAVDESRDRLAISRGRKVFFGPAAGCADCHSGPHYTDGDIHDVGSGAPSDRYPGYNTPSLRGAALRLRLMHDGRATSLDALLRNHHRPQDVSGTRGLSEAQRRDLIEFLKTL